MNNNELKRKGHELKFKNGVYELYYDGEFIVQSCNLEDIMKAFDDIENNNNEVELW